MKHGAVVCVLLRSLVLCGAMMTAGHVYAEGISGTYVGKNPTSAFLIQIVQTSDGRLTGHYAQITLQADGKLSEMNASVTGASDGHTVALNIQSPVPLSGSLSLSGTIDGSLLHVSGGNSAHCNRPSFVDFLICNQYHGRSRLEKFKKQPKIGSL